MKITEIQDLIKFVARSGVTEVEIEQANFKITIKSEGPKKRGGKPNQDQGEMYMAPQMPMQMPQMAIQQQQAPQAQAAQQTAQAAPAPQAEPKEDVSKYVTIKSPMIGTFYRSSGPDKDPFVSVGDEIKPGKVICIVEAMKLFNEIEAETTGKIVKVLLDDASPVEYDQPLFLVDPA
jgi:acetyl-CoA carboxylase biotin carboxyl carrier protein